MTDTMHIVFTAVTVALMLIMLISGAATFGKRFRYYSVATIMVLLAFGILTGISSPAMAVKKRIALLKASKTDLLSTETFCAALFYFLRANAIK